MRSLIVTAVVLAMATMFVFQVAADAEQPTSSHFGTTAHARARPRYASALSDSPVSGTVECLYETMIRWRRVPDCTLTDCTPWEHDHHEPALAARARYADIASDIAHNATAPLTLLAIAFEESGFERLVDDGTCNSPALMAGMHLPYHCDHGFAHTIFQIHDGTLTPDDRPRAVRAAQALYDLSPAAWTTWPRVRALVEREAYEHGECW